jgi:hypothetical protein
LGGMYFIEKLNNHLPPKRHLYYECSNEEKATLGFDYDKWCIGWVLYELTTRGFDKPSFTCTSPSQYLNSTSKDLSAHLNTKFPNFYVNLKK